MEESTKDCAADKHKHVGIVGKADQIRPDR